MRSPTSECYLRAGPELLYVWPAPDWAVFLVSALRKDNQRPDRDTGWRQGATSWPAGMRYFGADGTDPSVGPNCPVPQSPWDARFAMRCYRLCSVG